MAVATVSTPIYDANEAALFRGLAPIVPDGVTDNQAAILARLNKIAALPTTPVNLRRGILQLPAGVIRLASPLTWPSAASDVQMVGLGIGVTECVADHSGKSSGTPTGATISIANSISRVRIADLTIRGASDTDETSPYDHILINTSGADIMAERILFKWARHCGLRTSTFSGSNVSAVDCVFEDIITSTSNITNGGAGMLCKGGNGYRIVGCTFRRCGKDTLSHGVYVSDAANGCIVGCYFDQSSNSNCRLQVYDDAAIGWTVVGNTFLGLSNANDRFNYFGGRDNVFSSNGFYDSRVKVYADGSVFIGNSFKFTGTTVFTRCFEIGGSARVENIFAGNSMRVTTPSTSWRMFHLGQSLQRSTVVNNSVVGGLLLYCAADTCDANVIKDNKVYYSGYSSSTIGLIHNENVGYLQNSLIEGNFFDLGTGTGLALLDQTGNSNNYRNNRLGTGTVSNTTNYLYTEGPDRVRVYYGSATWDPSSLLPGFGTSTTVTVSGAAVGDQVVVNSSASVPAGCTLTGQVTSANTVSIVLWNGSGSTQDVGSGTIGVMVFHKV
jgi:hypothetical protein